MRATNKHHDYDRRDETLADVWANFLTILFHLVLILPIWLYQTYMETFHGGLVRVTGSLLSCEKVGEKEWVSVIRADTGQSWRVKTDHSLGRPCSKDHWHGLTDEFPADCVRELTPPKRAEPDMVDGDDWQAQLCC